MERKRLQVKNASKKSKGAKLIKLVDKISNLRDIANSPPATWDLQRRSDYFDWAKAVIDGLRGASPRLEAIFDRAYRGKPKATNEDRRNKE